MKAPIKKLQNKYRYQVLMRVDANDRQLLDTIFYTVNKYNNRSTSVVFEINTNNLV